MVFYKPVSKDRAKEMAKEIRFFSTHNHTEISNFRLRDCIIKIPDLINRSIELGYSGVCCTDHEALSAHVRFIKRYKEIKENKEKYDKLKVNKTDEEIEKELEKDDNKSIKKNLKYYKNFENFKIGLGNEIYLVDRPEEDGKISKFFHFILIAKDKKGYEQIRRISSDSAWKNWYIRRNRNRFWGSNLDNSKKSVYQTTYEVLIGLSKLLAPISPYISEEIYQNLTNEESVHLSSFPKCDESLIDLKLEEKMDLVRDLISLGRNAREEAKIKVRQPISEVLIDGKNKDILSDLTSLITDELNVKKLTFVDDLSLYMNFIIRPNFKETGKLFGNKMKEYQTFLNNLTEKDKETLLNGGTLKFEEFDIDKNLVDIRIESKEGFDCINEGNNFIILNTTLTEDLIKEGLARELVSKVQNMRKEKDFNIEDRINLFYNGNSYFESVLKEFESYIKEETLALSLIKKEDLTNLVKLNDLDVYLDIEKR